jgi:DNA primase
MLEETFEKCSEEGFVAERYFLNHPDPEISHLAVNLVSDKYPLSKVHSKFQRIEEESERLLDTIPYVVLVYKDAILKKQISDLASKIKILQDQKDIDQSMELMKELIKLKEAQKLIAKHAGERIVLKM